MSLPKTAEFARMIRGAATAGELAGYRAMFTALDRQQAKLLQIRSKGRTLLEQARTRARSLDGRADMEFLGKAIEAAEKLDQATPIDENFWERLENRPGRI